MENNYYSPVQILENNIKAGINKANMGLLKTPIERISFN